MNYIINWSNDEHFDDESNLEKVFPVTSDLCWVINSGKKIDRVDIQISEYRYLFVSSREVSLAKGSHFRCDNKFK